MTLFHFNFFRLGCHIRMACYQNAYCFAYSGCRLLGCVEFVQPDILRVCTARLFKVEVLLLLLSLFPFSLLCFKLSLFSKAFDIFIVIILMCITKVIWFNILQMTKNAALCPYSLSVHERLRKIIYSAELFQRCNIILQDLITVGLLCLFVYLYILVYHRLTLTLTKWIKMDMLHISRLCNSLRELGRTFVMDAFRVEMWTIGTWQR